MKHATDVSRVPQLYLSVLLVNFQVFTHIEVGNSPAVGQLDIRAVKSRRRTGKFV